jgi:uncharacterized protein (DUF2141 family)
MLSRKTAAVLAAMLFPLLAHAELLTLKIVVTGVTPSTGQIETTVFNTSESFMKEPIMQETNPVTGEGDFVVSFFGLEPGEYAVVAVHDENDNGVLDTGFLGFGGESIAYSNDVKPFLGRPDFDETKVTVDAEHLEITINME